jgi:hypothetical protein
MVNPLPPKLSQQSKSDGKAPKLSPRNFVDPEVGSMPMEINSIIASYLDRPSQLIFKTLDPEAVRQNRDTLINQAYQKLKQKFSIPDDQNKPVYQTTDKELKLAISFMPDDLLEEIQKNKIPANIFYEPSRQQIIYQTDLGYIKYDKHPDPVHGDIFIGRTYRDNLGFLITEEDMHSAKGCLIYKDNQGRNKIKDVGTFYASIYLDGDGCERTIDKLDGQSILEIGTFKEGKFVSGTRMIQNIDGTCVVYTPSTKFFSKGTFDQAGRLNGSGSKTTQYPDGSYLIEKGVFKDDKLEKGSLTKQLPDGTRIEIGTVTPPSFWSRAQK